MCCVLASFRKFYSSEKSTDITYDFEIALALYFTMCCCLNYIFSCFDLCFNADKEQQAIGIILCYRQSGCCPCTICDKQDEDMSCALICFSRRADPFGCIPDLFENKICSGNTKENQILGAICFGKQSGCCPCLFCNEKVGTTVFGFMCCGNNLNVCFCPAQCDQYLFRNCKPEDCFSLCFKCFCSGFFLLCRS